MKDGTSRKKSEDAVSSLLESGLQELGIGRDDTTLRRLTELVLLLEEWSGRINLTGHRGPLEIANRLVLDAVALSTAIPELQEAQSVADLGSGAGFPGLPLALLNPHLHVSLIDSRLKRHHFRRAARRQIELENVTSILGRSDEVETKPCDIVVAQAMTTPRKAFELMAQWAHPDSLLVLPASEAAGIPDCPPGISEPVLREYVVPHTGTRRKLWVARPDPA